ncbi:MAG: NAD-dependent epimerase/dehydratase family protein [Kofleriaceae bacterium]|nr:NAD-dependent epimerase/dehydratase family protein [Kofleriaceae bacterium]
MLPAMVTTWVVLGCGYVGAALAADRVAAAGVVVVAVRRDASRRWPGCGPGWARRCAPRRWRSTTPPRSRPRSRAARWSCTRRRQARRRSRRARRRGGDGGARAAAARLVYVSSTGVYAAGGGARVDETWPTAPVTASGVARLAAERALLAAARAAGLAAVALRAPGIYGPGRGVTARLRAGTYRIVGDGAAHVSRIHVDDLVAAIVAVAGAAALGHDVYNVADREPCPSAVYGDAAAARLGLPPPPRVAVDAVSPEVAGMLLADRRVDASRLERELGWTPRWPSWRDALDAELAGVVPAT